MTTMRGVVVVYVIADEGGVIWWHRLRWGGAKEFNCASQDWWLCGWWVLGGSGGNTRVKGF